MIQQPKITQQILPRQARAELGLTARAFAPSNIALVKYWGKRNFELNLPMTDSLSISLGNLGTTTKLTICSAKHQIKLDGQSVAETSSFAKRLIEFLELCRPNPSIFYQVDTISDIPVAAGLASSASGFAVLVKALNRLHAWQLSEQQLSVLARMGSGSACRSLWNGFVKWQRGIRDDGMDSFAQPLDINWPDLRIGLLLLSTTPKAIGSREAMNITVNTSQLYQSWPAQVAEDIISMEQALVTKDFELLGSTSEANAIMMHETMLTSDPKIEYSTPETCAARKQVQKLRESGVSVYFTQDAGPNLKLLFLAKDQDAILSEFRSLKVINPFITG